MGKQNDVGVFQLENGKWAFRYTFTKNGKRSSKRSCKDEFGNSLNIKRAAIKARQISVDAEALNQPLKPVERKTVAEVFKEYREKGCSGKAYQTTVSSKGVVKAVGNGTATITVKVKDGSGKKATCKITVGTTNTPSNNTPIHTAIIGVKLNLGMINVVYGNHELHTQIDLTGDGNADQLDIQATGTGWSDNKFNGTLSISVNGKNAQKFTLSSDNVCISYIALKNNIQIIRVQSGYSYSEDDFFIQYNKATNKFQTVLNEKLGGFSHAYTILDDIAFNGNNTIKIKYLIQPYLTGAVNVEYTYVYSNGVFKRASDTAAATSLYYKDKSKLTSEYYQDGYQNYFYDNKFVAMKNLVFYSSPSGKNNFTLKKVLLLLQRDFVQKTIITI